MSTYSNQAAWLMQKSQALTVSEAPVREPGEGELLVRNRAVAINPFDGVVQALGSMITPWVSYPAILGSDLAGEIVAVGPGVTRFRIGDRVLGLALGIDKLSNSPAEGAFQNYVILRAAAASAIPDDLEFAQAAVLPLAIATAACGLFLENQLGLHTPSANPKPAGKTILVWGGSTSVGSCAIQLAKAAGYDVITTASPKNFKYVGDLGARQAFDYRGRNVVANIVKEMKGREFAGALAISAGSGAFCIDIAGQCRGRRVVSMASAPVPIDDAPLTKQARWKARKLPRLAMGFLGLKLRARFRGVAARSVWGTDLLDKPLGKIIFNEFLGPALSSGTFVAAPPPLLAGHSVGEIAAAMALHRRGVSATKVVVSL